MSILEKLITGIIVIVTAFVLVMFLVDLTSKGDNNNA